MRRSTRLLAVVLACRLRSTGKASAFVPPGLDVALTPTRVVGERLGFASSAGAFSE